MAATKSMTREWKTRGKAESRKKKVEIAKRKIACYEYQSTPSATLRVKAFVSLRHSFGNINAPSSQGLCKRVQSKFTCCCKRAQPRLAKSSAKLRYRFAVPLRSGTIILLIQNPNKTHNTATHTQRWTAILLCFPFSVFRFPFSVFPFPLSAFCFLLSAFYKKSAPMQKHRSTFFIERLLIT